MNQVDIAANLLAGRTCDNCSWNHSFYNTIRGVSTIRCGKNQDHHDDDYTPIPTFCPDEFTCENWSEHKERRPLFLGKAYSVKIKE